MDFMFLDVIVLMSM